MHLQVPLLYRLIEFTETMWNHDLSIGARLNQITEMQNQHSHDVLDIYRQGIITGQATFNTVVPDWSDWDKGHLSSPRIVCMDGKTMVGWAALSAVSSRCVYAGVAEVSIYIAANFRGQGIGRKLLQELIERSELQNIWTLQSGIFPENIASIKIHESCGFRLVGRRERLGQMNGVWRDVLFFERRSQLI